MVGASSPRSSSSAGHQQHPVGRPRVALDHHQPLARVDEVERHLPVPVELGRELLDRRQRVRGVDREELDAGRVLPLARRAVGHVGRDLASVDARVGAVHRPVHELLHQPRVRLGRVHVVGAERARERPGVGHQADPAARERRAAEVLRKALDRRLQLVLVVRHDGLRRAQPELVAELLEGPLVVHLRQRPEGRGVQPGHLREPLVLGREVEDLLEHRHDQLDLVLGDVALDVVDEGRGVVGGRRGRRVSGQVLRMAARRRRVAVAGVDLVPALAELADHVQSERHPGAGDQQLHRGATLLRSVRGGCPGSTSRRGAGPSSASDTAPGARGRARRRSGGRDRRVRGWRR